MSMIEKLRQVFIGLTHQSEAHENVRKVRGLVAAVGKAGRDPEELSKTLMGFVEAQQQFQKEFDSWVEPENLAEGKGGPFDGLDLRHWLVLAERAGVPYIPGKVILSLTEEQMSIASGSMNLPDTASVRRAKQTVSKLKSDLDIENRDRPQEIDPSEIEEKLFDAMDNVPEGWMVRSARCGGSNLKALAGFGLYDTSDPTVRFGPALEFGPGWIRQGNRRKIQTDDTRTVTAAAQGPGMTHFLARPWVKASRYIVAEDPHRANTPFEGKGQWPAEWRAIVEQGVVVAVASYYGWTDSATPETAKIVLQVRQAAQRIVDEAMKQKAYPRSADLEHIRNAAMWLSDREDLKNSLETRYAKDTVACSLDFIETEEGPTLLEGGPPVSSFGGGHPCAFAGAGISGRTLDPPVQLNGVAFRALPGVIIADPSTWDGKDSPQAREGTILNWDEVEQLASQID